MTSDGGLEVTGLENPNGFTQNTNPDQPPMAPEQQYQMPPDTDTVGFTTRHLVEYDSCIASVNNPNYGNDPIHIRSHNPGAGTVSFDVFQVYKASEISWVAVDYIDSTGSENCRKVNSIDHVFDERMKDFTAQCDANGQAEVWIHIHDGSKAIGQADMVCNKKKDPICPIPDHTDMIPARCEPSQDIEANNKCHFRYVIDCNAVFASTAGRRRLQSIEGPGPGPGLQRPGGPLPPAIVTPVETEKGRVLVKEGLPLFGASVFKECTHRRTKRADGQVIYNNFKFGNGIQNAGLEANGNERGLRGPRRSHNLEVIDIQG